MEEIPQSEKVFAGANLIISDDQNRMKKEQDILVVTDNPKHPLHTALLEYISSAFRHLPDGVDGFVQALYATSSSRCKRC